MDIEGRGWHFPDMEGPDLSKELFPGEHALWGSLKTTTINEIFGDYADPDDTTANDNGDSPEEETVAHLSRYPHIVLSIAGLGLAGVPAFVCRKKRRVHTTKATFSPTNIGT